MIAFRVLTGFACLAVAAFAGDNGNGNGNGDPAGAGASGKVIHETRDAHASINASANFPITYHGGPIIPGTTKMYYIWYGNAGQWGSDSTASILTDFANHIGASAYYNITTGYSGLVNGLTTNVTASVAYGGSTVDGNTSTSPTSLNDASVQSIVSSAITSGRLPKDSNG